MFCPKCGKELPEGALFCTACGNKLKKAEETSSFQVPAVNKAGYDQSQPLLMQEEGVCPSCGSHDCEIQVQQNVTSSGSNYSVGMGCLGFLLTGPFGLLCGLCGTGRKTTTTHQSMWVCKKCGSLFPTRKARVSGFINGTATLCGIVAALAALAVLYVIDSLWVLAILFGVMAAGFAFLLRYIVKKNVGDGSVRDAVVNGILTEQEYSSFKSTCILISVISAVLVLLIIGVIMNV